MGVRPFNAHFLSSSKQNKMISINSFDEFKANFVISADRLPYIKAEGIEILECETYTSDTVLDWEDFLSITIKVTNLTLLLLLQAGIRLGGDQMKKIYQ
jgi:hypothetical protein